MTTEEVIIARVKIMSATTKLIFLNNKLVSTTEKSYLSHCRVILATEEVIKATLKNSLTTTKVILTTEVVIRATLTATLWPVKK